jgi:hypothetical protein
MPLECYCYVFTLAQLMVRFFFHRQLTQLFPQHGQAAWASAQPIFLRCLWFKHCSALPPGGMFTDSETWKLTVFLQNPQRYKNIDALLRLPDEVVFSLLSLWPPRMWATSTSGPWSSGTDGIKLFTVVIYEFS